MQAGIPTTEDYNVVSYEGVRYLEQTAYRGRRCSASVAYLNGARRRPNLRIETQAHATRIIFEEFLKEFPRFARVDARLPWMPSTTFRSPMRLDLAIH